MSSRRKFLRNTAFSSLAVLPLNTVFALSSSDNSLESFQKQKNLLSETEYWKAVRMQFPLKQGQTYFNNATIGPLPDYTISRMIDNMRENAIHAAETDYKSAGPQLLTGYFKYESLRTKVGKLINANFDEIALTQNATFGMNYVANGLDLKKGDELLNTNQEHGGGYAAWSYLYSCLCFPVSLPSQPLLPSSMYTSSTVFETRSSTSSTRCILRGFVSRFCQSSTAA
ncbi:hypothetical protein ES705_18541 [subsurface metagenome]